MNGQDRKQAVRAPVRERSVLKCRLRLMDVGSVEELWLAAGIREHLAGAWSSWRRTDTLEQTTYRRLWGTLAGKVSGIF